MRLRQLLPVSLLAVLALTACGEDTSEDTGPTPFSTEEAFESTAPAESSTAAETGTATAGSSASTGELTLTVGGEAVPLSPDVVRCAGEPGDIKHMIGKTSNRPPIVEVDGAEFLKVVLEEGEPYVAESPVGMSFLEEGVTFDGVTLGDVTLDGTMTCTDWQS